MDKWVTGSEELLDLWYLNFDELAFVAEKPEKSRLDYALRIRFYSIYGKFPRQSDNFPDNVINYVADQVESPDTFWPIMASRTVRRRNLDVKEFVGFEPLSKTRHEEFLKWFYNQAEFLNMPSGKIESEIRHWCIARQYESPTNTEISRLIEAVHSKFEKAECVRIGDHLSIEAKKMILNCIDVAPGVPSIMDIRADPGRVGKENFNQICEKLKFITALELPITYISSINEDWRKRVARRMARFRTIDIRRLNDELKIGMFSVYLTSRLPEVTDSLITVLVDSVHKIETKAIRNIEKLIAKQVHNVYNREKLLVDILQAVIENPCDTAGNVVFSLINLKDAEALIEKQKSRNKWAIDVFSEMHGSWRTHYRPMLKNLLETVEFGSTVSKYRPIIEAFDWISINYDRRTPILVRNREVPIEGVVPKQYLKAVVRGEYVDKLSYELCAIISLREKLGTCEIWVPGSEKYKNPEDDIPQDFEECRIEYYDELNLDMDARSFISGLKEELKTQLLALDRELPRNKFVNVEVNHVKRAAKFKLHHYWHYRNQKGCCR